MATILPMGAKASDDTCSLESNDHNHFQVSFAYWVGNPHGEPVQGFGYNASAVDGLVCWTGISHETLDTRIIPRGASRLRVGYSPYWPGGPEDRGLETMCFAGPTLAIRLDGLGWIGQTATMTCHPRAYVLDWIPIPNAPVNSGTLRLSLTDDKGRPDSTTFHVL